VRRPRDTPDRVIRSGSEEALRIFLCYASDDAPAVRKLYQHLRSCGFSPWLDEQDIPAGAAWRDAIEEAVENSHVVLVCLSRNSVQKRGFVQKEIKLALNFADYQPEGAVFVMPVKLEPCATPARLQTWQAVDLFEPDGFHRLLETLNSCRDRSHSPASSPPLRDTAAHGPQTGFGPPHVVSTLVEPFIYWWSRGIAIHTLETCGHASDIRPAILALAAGVGIGQLVRAPVIALYAPEVQISHLVLSLVTIGNAVFFALLLWLFLRLLRTRITFREASSACMYGFSAAIPLLTVLSVEQLAEAIHLFRAIGDPSLPYVSAATLSLRV
jgi:hypothetical protein